jgi:hypothetical protein
MDDHLSVWDQQRYMNAGLLHHAYARNHNLLSLFPTTPQEGTLRPHICNITIITAPGTS